MEQSREIPGESPEDRAHRISNTLTLEVCFLAFIALVVVAAFFEALSYQLVSSRTPFVIMAPLAIVILIQARRLWALRDQTHFKARFGAAISGGNTVLNKILTMCVWMVGLMITVVALGHYIGIGALSFVLMRWLSGERVAMAAGVAIATTAAIFMVFEVGFNVELYRGLLFRYFAGYRDF